MMIKHEELKMRITYEPSRLSSTHIMDAYETLIPTINRIISDVPTQDRKSAETPDNKGEQL